MKKVEKKTIRSKQVIAIGSMLLLLMAGVTGCGSKNKKSGKPEIALPFPNHPFSTGSFFSRHSIMPSLSI